MEQRIEGFLDFLRVEKRVSGNTVAAYRNDLSQFIAFVTEEAARRGLGAEWSSVDRSMITEYILDLKERKYAPATVARKVAAVKSLFGFLVGDGAVEQDPLEGMASPRVKQGLPKPLSVAEVDALLEQTARSSMPEAKRDRAMLELLYASGMRVSEMVSLNVADVNLQAGYVRCLGKGSKERVIPLHQQAVDAVRAYLKEARSRFPLARDEQALFLNQRGKRLTRQGFWLILRGYARAADIQSEVTPHTLRHSFATHMLHRGMPLRNVQELLGHASISTTQVYTQVPGDYVRREYDKAHPRAK
ncbi:MAG: site-specific tyrosine recombinase XerD [Chloroflexi bacterium]|nr:site-specific tyrosine recombinase XerD [Chloroflexota bacterium]